MRHYFVLSLLLLVLLSSGCLNLDPQAMALANPMIKEFLDEHPNADIKITHFSAEDSESILEQIRADCENEYIGAKEFYKVNIEDPDTDFYAVVWVDWESKIVECAWKAGAEGEDAEEAEKEISKPKEESGCKHHSMYMCKDGDVYWYDSCRNREDKKEDCEYGCTWGSEVCSERGVCKSHAKADCYGEHVYWFDSCGHVQEKKEYCDYGCYRGFCKEADEEWEDECEEHYEYRCHNGHVYWFDSCGNREGKKEYCDYGCENNACLDGDEGEECSEHSYYDCYNGDLYWFDSCGNIEEKKLDCEYTCVNDTCIDYVPNCTSHATYACHEGFLFWYDSCGVMEDLKENCSYGCENGACLGEPEQEGVPDLAVTGLIFDPEEPEEGDSVYVEAETKNFGDGASGVVNIKWYVDGEQYGYGSFGPMQPGATEPDYSDNVRTSWDAVGGYHYIEYEIDADDFEDESDETNNRYGRNITVSCPDGYVINADGCVPEESSVTFNLHLRISECSTHGTDCDNDNETETYGCALEGATVTLEAENGWNGYSAELVVNSGEDSEVGMAPAGLPEWIRFDSIPVWTATPDYQADEGFYRITVSKSGYTTKTGLVGIFGTTGGDLYWSREPVGNYICLNEA
jgi:hypothetical protein